MHRSLAYRQEVEDNVSYAHALAEKVRVPTLNPHELSPAYHLMHAAILNVLGPTHQGQTADVIARDAFTALLQNRNVDHIPRWIGQLSRDLTVSDDDLLCDRMISGKTFFFAGFHTGPYWAIFQWLISRGSDITTLLPPSLAPKQLEIEAAHAAICQVCGSSSRITFVDPSERSFLVSARDLIRHGNHLVMFVDGYSGSRVNAKKRSAIFPFFQAELSVSTSPFSLARLFGLDLIPFNAEITKEERILHLHKAVSIPPSERSFDTQVSELYSHLLRFVSREPAHWEGWLYLHNYFSDCFLDSLNGRLTLDIARDTRDRYFVMQNGSDSFFVDKLTYRQTLCKPLYGGTHAEGTSLKSSIL